MRIILISGKAQHGKDTVAQLIKEELGKGHNRVLITHYADLLKYICKMFFNWDGNKDETGRAILQRVGTDVIRKDNPDFWVDFISIILKYCKEEWDYVIIPDCRFPNEIKNIKSAGYEAVHLRVVRNNFKSTLTEEQQKHPSETALDTIKPDFYIFNDSDMINLKYNVETFVKCYTGGIE